MMDDDVRRLLRWIACAVAGLLFAVGALSYAKGAEARAVIRRHEHRKAFEAVQGFNFDGFRAASRLRCSDRLMAELLTCTGFMFDVDGHRNDFAYVCTENGCTWIIEP